MGENGKNTKQKKKGSGAFYNVIIVILIGIIAFSGYRIYQIKHAYNEGTRAYDKIEKMAVKETEDKGREIDWDTLLGKYPDVVAWIYSPGTPINYPIAQADDNDKYLRHLLSGEYNVKGTIFADYRCRPFMKTFNTIIYGHYMKDGTIFGGLDRYAREEGFYKDHKNMYLLTPSGNYRLEVLAGATIKDTSDFYNPQPAPGAGEMQFIDDLLALNEVDSDPVPRSKIGNVIMFSTCTRASDDNRFALWCLPVAMGASEVVPTE